MRANNELSKVSTRPTQKSVVYYGIIVSNPKKKLRIPFMIVSKNTVPGTNLAKNRKYKILKLKGIIHSGLLKILFQKDILTRLALTGFWKHGFCNCFYHSHIDKSGPLA